MPALRVRHREPAHELGQVAVFPGPEDQVPMIGHDTIPEQADGDPILSVDQNADEGVVIAWFLKDLVPRHGAIQHVVDIAASSMAKASKHAINVEDEVVAKRTTPDPFLFLCLRQ